MINEIDDELDDEVFAFLKYEGELVSDGFMDAKKSGEALINLDEALRYFLFQESSELKITEFEIPVRIRKGSWETVFLENFDQMLLKASATWAASKYFGSMLSQMAKNDFDKVGFKSIFKRAYKAMTWVIKIAKHLGSMTKKKFEKLKFTKKNQAVLLENEKGEILEVPVEYLEVFTNCPANLFNNLARVIEVERELIIGFSDTEKNEKETVRITTKSKAIFITDDDTDEVLFPELTHDSYVELEGHITRGNEKSNTIGFMYLGHILTSYPVNGNIKDYKNSLFTNCVIKGYVDRLDKKTGEFIEKRPRIRFLEIVGNSTETDQTALFE